MNRRRAWHQRLARKIARRTSSPGRFFSPLVLFAAICLVICIAALCAGFKTAALALAASCFTSLWRMRQCCGGGRHVWASADAPAASSGEL